MKTVILTLSLITPAHALDVIETKQPATCEVNKLPVPCAFFEAMLNLLRSKLSHCQHGETCPVKS